MIHEAHDHLDKKAYESPVGFGIMGYAPYELLPYLCLIGIFD
jgi:hypothetical protein